MTTEIKEPAWLTAAADQKVAQLAELVPGGVAAGHVMVALLTEPDRDGDDWDDWSISCDNCGKVCPDDLLTGTLTRQLHGQKVTLAFGSCPECWGAA